MSRLAIIPVATLSNFYNIAAMDSLERSPSPFAAFAAGVQPQTPLRAAINAAYRRPETECLPPLLEEASLGDAQAEAARALARRLVETLRRRQKSGGVEGLIHEYDLSSAEGVALMCLAEALLRIPDSATRDALIRDKIGGGDWQAHLGSSPSLFVNAATWGLVIAGRLTMIPSETTLAAALTRLLGKGGEPLIRRGVDMAMRLMGEQFVTGQNIAEALTRSRKMEAKGFRYSYDMLGEAAVTAEDAARYLADYEAAIHAIGKAANGRGVLDGPGISIKLSALHPRYCRAQRARVMAELLPRVLKLVRLAHHYDIGLNIDAEEADRLDISLDLLEAVCATQAFEGWHGIGFVVQAYQKRAPFVLDWVIDLARRTRHRLMIRLVKGAYWDSEIKRAQVDGLEGFPVFTRKIYSDVSYLACAKKLLAAPDAVFPQFATHNAQTLASIAVMAGEKYHKGQYEFQCLHGMGEPLYEEVVGPNKLNRPCRIYAPVGTHETLLAYLVRRLLENGANSSFVNRIADPEVPVEELTADPVAQALAINPPGAPHERIKAPYALLGARSNSKGFDISSEQALAALAPGLAASATAEWRAGAGVLTGVPVRNPADRRDVIGFVQDAEAAAIAAAAARAEMASPAWAATPVAERADGLRRAADAMEAKMPALLGLLMREAGKTLGNAVGEVREAVDFLRYYADEAEKLPPAARALGALACISPWNFPLAIFTGQIAACLAAGNTVLAKPAEETPLIAAEAVRILHEAGIPADALQFLPGDGTVGAALVEDSRIQGVVFTGSGAAARAIQAALAERLSHHGNPIPLIAETGGQNAMIVDSSALTEQVVGDVIASAFDSAGQRCSALRILCVQEDVAQRTLAMLIGAMRELRIGVPVTLDVDIGPVISAAARDGIIAHIETMRARGHKITSLELPESARDGYFVPPTIIEISRIADVECEVFGPVLHLLPYKRGALDRLIEDINATGYGLTFGLHTRLDEMVAHVTQRISAGNLYVNRNIIGAVVGVQPFGGHGLSGTGPKAGGPLYLRRLVSAPPLPVAGSALPGPVGEENLYTLRPRGVIAALSDSEAALRVQLEAIAATGNIALVPREHSALKNLPANAIIADDWLAEPRLAGVLFAGSSEMLRSVNRQLAARPGPILAVHVPENGAYRLEFLREEVAVSTNTAAAGGNASLLAIS
jgi:RHH-type proline utilization regulon transcriptional repressor/proline dehydrogenase/delta 1-pyrroline-5-carboxylate dehydrogenase